MAEIMGTDMMYPEDTGFELSMVNVALPLPPFGKGQEELNHKAQDLFQRKVLEERKVGAPKFEHDGRLWTRLSGQVWLEVSCVEVYDGAADGVVRSKTLRRRRIISRRPARRSPKSWGSTSTSR